MKEETLVTVDIEDGMTCDVIGDVHGTKQSLVTLTASGLNLFFRSILRRAPSLYTHWRTDGKALPSV